MDRKKLTKTLIILILFIFIVNFLANRFYWYYSIWYFDMPMHFLGGLWVGLATIYFFTRKNLDYIISTAFILKILLSVLLIGVGWELFEILVNHLIVQNNFNTLDTISDIFFDLAGGGAALLYFFKKSMPSGGNGVHPVVEL